MEFNYPKKKYANYQQNKNYNNDQARPNFQNKKHMKFSQKFTKNAYPQEKPQFNINLYYNERMFENPWKNLQSPIQFQQNLPKSLGTPDNIISEFKERMQNPWKEFP